MSFKWILAALATLAFEAFACSPRPPLRLGEPVPREASAADFHAESDALLLEGVPEAISEDKSRKGILRVRVTRWLKGSGPSELEVTGFYVYRAEPGACPQSGNSVALGKRHLLVLESATADGHGVAFRKREIAAGSVTDVAWRIEY